MGQRVYIPGRSHLLTDGLPALCRAPRCLKDPQPGSLWCEDCLRRTELRVGKFEGGSLVYMVGVPCGSGPVKIGVTSHLLRRLGELRLEHRESGLEILGFVRSSRILERSLHAVLAGSCAHGEWFYRTSQVLGLMSLMSKRDRDGVRQYMRDLVSEMKERA